ncbi:MAG: DNA polymerase III subunit gamma/tau [Sedimentisphaeraceae bacterium JB056]
MAYTVLARRYRSQTFDDVVGQDAIAQTLENAIKTGRVAHAYLFCGTRGVGKTTLARVLAKSLNCLRVDAPTTTPCCECESCVAVNTGEDIDVIEIDGASNNGVDNIRELRNNAIFRPARSRYKVYIIDEIHMLSTGAFNALLKILEEPPAHVKFIFATTEPNKVLPTIQSRCQRFDFRAIDAACIGKQLRSVLDSEHLTYTDDFITTVSRLANGSMRDGLSLLDQVISTGEQPLSLEVLEATLGQPGRQHIASLLSCIAEKDAAGALTITDKLLTDGMSCLQIADALVEYMRDVMVASTAGSDSPLVILTAAERETVSDLSQKFDIASLVYGVTAFEKMRSTIKNSENSRAILEASIVRLALSENFISVQSLLQRLGRGGGVAVKKNSGSSGASINPSSRVSNRAQGIAGSRPMKAKTEANAASNTANLPQIPCQTIDDFTSKWNAISSAVTASEPMIATLLTGGVPISFENSLLKLQFPQNSMSIKLLADPNRMVRLCDVLSAIIGIDIKVEPVAAGVVASIPKPKGAKTSSKERQEVLNNPGVKTILKAFKARVVDISTGE